RAALCAELHQAFFETHSNRLKKFRSTLQAIQAIGHRAHRALRILIISAPIKHPAVLSFPHPAPLLKEKRYALLPALPPNRDHPLPLHGTSPRPALAADDHPGYARQVDLAQVFEQRLEG